MSRMPTKVKTFWCAFHKGDAARKCYSDTCPDLKQTPPTQRVKMLRDNGVNCVHCCSDHKAADCQKKDRVCGGQIDDRGCKKRHFAHELFCVEAKVFTVSMSVEHSGEGVMLSIMRISAPK